MGIRKNFVYNSLLTVSNYIFPLITYPYISRVLGVSNIGICNFIDSIINYFVIFSMLGINTIGIREIARNKDNHSDLQRTFSSLYSLLLISTSIMLFILIIATFYVPKLYAHMDMMVLGMVKLVFNLFLTEWFFKGIENFKYITIRSIIVKTLFVISVLVFVRDSNDYKIYYSLIVGVIVFNSLLNNRYRRRFVKFSLKKLDFSIYLKSFIILGFYAILTSMYTSFNVIYLGFVSGTTQVGYYTTATKLLSIMLSLYTAFTAVMIPHMSFLVAKNEKKEINKIIKNSYNILISLGIPIIIVAMFFAPQIISIVSGKGYEGAIIPMRIVIPLILVIGMEQIIVLQLLLPLKKDKAILINSTIGATIGLLANFLLVKRFDAIGSSIVWGCSETAVLISSQIAVKKYTGICFPIKLLIKNIIYYSPIAIICFVFLYFIKLSSMLCFFIAAATSLTYWICFQLFYLKNYMLISAIRNKFKKRH